MQIINKGQTNTLVFTLSEKVTLTNPVFLFELKCQSNNQSYYFTSADISAYPSRYNKFSITDGSDVTLTTAGQYDYRIWEQPQHVGLGTVNLDPANATTLLETGIILVKNTAPTFIVHQMPEETIVVYGATE